MPSQSKLTIIEKELNIPSSKILTVSQLNDYIEKILTNDQKLIALYLIGEVSNFRRFPSGHAYLDIKDEHTLVSCIIYNHNLKKMKYIPEEGKEVLLLASIIVYKKTGKYELSIQQAFPIGEGILSARFRKLKNKLEKKGMFDLKYKKEIPLLPRCIGIATSIDGSAIRDILDTIINRFPNINIIISPTTVQGKNAPESIINSINILNKIEEIDTIILGRGGGSLEDLDCFNDEKVADAIFNSKKPIISAVGHEDDWTISDFVADKRAITPTHSAHLVILNKKEAIDALINFKTRLENSREHYKIKTKVKTYKIIIIIAIILLIIYILWRLLT